MQMKKAIETLVKEKYITILDAQGTGASVPQWVSGGGVAYPLEGLPPMTPEILRAAYDIPIGCRIDSKPLESALCFADIADGEEPLTPEKLQLQPGDEAVSSYETPDGTLFLCRKYLKPVLDGSQVGIYMRRTADGQIYGAVKDGMKLTALVMPYRCVTPEWIGELESVTARLALALERADKFDW